MARLSPHSLYTKQQNCADRRRQEDQFDAYYHLFHGTKLLKIHGIQAKGKSKKTLIAEKIDNDEL